MPPVQVPAPETKETPEKTRREPAVPRIVLTFEQVKQRIDSERGDGPKCPNSVARAILKCDFPERKIKEIKLALGEIAKAAGSGTGWAFYGLVDYKIASLLVKFPTEFIEIARAAGSNTGLAFRSLSNEKIASFLAQNPQLLIDSFAEIVKEAGPEAQWVFFSIREDKTASVFLDFCRKEITFDKLMVAVLSSDTPAIELGRPLDELHFNEPERRKYLATLSPLQVFSLLNSNPEVFYPSSNSMLFDRLKKDLRGKPVAKLFEEYGLMDSEQCRNFLLRAINFGRFFGQQNSVLTEEDVASMLPTLLGPLSSGFDQTYFFLLANATGDIMNIPSLKEKIKSIVETELRSNLRDKQLRSALEFIAYMLNRDTFLLSKTNKRNIDNLEAKATYDPDFYKNDGKLTVLQVFDKLDTREDHWHMAIGWFTKYFGKRPTRGENGELIFENSKAKMTLYMGDEDSQNVDFIKNSFRKLRT